MRRVMVGRFSCRAVRDAYLRFSSLYSLYSKLSTRASQLASMMFSLTPTVPQTSSLVAAFDDHADAGGGAGFGVDDPDLVVDQLHVAKVREMPVQGLAQGGVEGVHRAVPFGHFVPHLRRRRGA